MNIIACMIGDGSRDVIISVSQVELAISSWMDNWAQHSISMSSLIIFFFCYFYNRMYLVGFAYRERERDRERKKEIKKRKKSK